MTYWKLFSALFFLLSSLLLQNKEGIYDDVSNSWYDEGQSQKTWDEAPKSSGSPEQDPWEISSMQMVGLYSIESKRWEADPPSFHRYARYLQTQPIPDPQGYQN